MIIQNFMVNRPYSYIITEYLSILVVFVLVIIVGAFTLQKNLEPDCTKNFLNSFHNLSCYFYVFTNYRYVFSGFK